MEIRHLAVSLFVWSNRNNRNKLHGEKMGDFKQAQASRSRDEGVLQPSNITSTEKVFSQPKTEMSVATSQMSAIGSRPPKKTTKKAVKEAKKEEE